MTRSRGILFSGALALAGCGGGTTPASDGGNNNDGPEATGDMTGALPTGAPCDKSSPCGGNKPSCELTDTNIKQSMPGGYCTGKCDPKQNDKATGYNAACSGSSGVCVSFAGAGQCYAGCSDKMGNMPCRDKYSCFNFSEGFVCMPDTLSQCDPTKNGSCPQDGGIPTDGGVSGEQCVQVGQDTVGECHPLCDYFAQNCPPGGGMQPQACIADSKSGLGSCIGSQGMAEGTACKYLNDCAPGSQCSGGVCRKYCGGPNTVACPMGQTCKDLSMDVKQTVVGICSK